MRDMRISWRTGISLTILFKSWVCNRSKTSPWKLSQNILGIFIPDAGRMWSFWRLFKVSKIKNYISASLLCRALYTSIKFCFIYSRQVQNGMSKLLTTWRVMGSCFVEFMIPLSVSRKYRWVNKKKGEKWEYSRVKSRIFRTSPG